MPTEKLKENPVLENETDDVLKEIKDLEDELEIEIADEEEELPKAPEDEDDDEEDTDGGDGEEEEDEGYDEDEDEDEEDEDEEEDLKQYSKNVQKRIRREVKLRKETEQQARHAVMQAIQQRNMAGQMAQKEHQEKSSLQEKYDNLEDQYVTLLENTITGGLETKQQQLIQARDEGDTAAEIKLQSELEDMRLHKRQLSEYKDTMQSTRQQRQQPQQPQQPQKPQQQQPPNPKAVEWLKKNTSWMKNKENAPAVVYLQTLDAQVLNEGYDPNSDEYYKEVDKRLKAAFPNIGKKKARKRTKSGNGSKPMTAPASATAGGTSRAKDGKIRLTKTDLDNMRAFGMDPENKDHLKAYAQQKVN